MSKIFINIMLNYNIKFEFIATCNFKFFTFTAMIFEQLHRPYELKIYEN